ncbi:hypothetical protein RR42_m1402 [Cupriavidus basilensis]|uniref:Uncharacterized protein n=1 Tax=Cupriavidus basilensis TaxID=68895 RepID=A0A0C4Y9A0_9BURK|nr:hypothetical protein RR42_m1402 [Cupriavidus basilensis]
MNGLSNALRVDFNARRYWCWQWRALGFSLLVSKRPHCR